MCTLLALFPHNVGAVRQMQSLCVHVIYSVSSQRWCCETNAVTVCARYLLCFLAALVLSDKCSHCTCTIFALFPHNVGIVKRKLSLYMHVMCFKLVLLDKPVTVCARYLLCPLTTLVYLVGPYEGSRTPVSYTHLTLPTTRSV